MNGSALITGMGYVKVGNRESFNHSFLSSYFYYKYDTFPEKAIKNRQNRCFYLPFN